MLRRILSRCALCAATVTCTLPARAQPAPAPSAQPSAEDKKAAGKRFAEGEKAFRAGEFAQAGQDFEEAFALAPHPDALWNAARSWERAGDAVRAATLYERWLAQAPPDAPDRKQGEAALAALVARVGRLVITGPAEAADLRVDGRAVTRGVTFFVSPGDHEVRGRLGDRERARTVAVAAGATVTAALSGDEPPTAAPVPTQAAIETRVGEPPATATVAPSASTGPDRPPPRQGWPPAVVWISGGVTLFGAAWTTWSGLDTLKARDTYLDTPDEKKTQGQLDDGKKRQVRTNFLLGVTIVGGLFTGIAAVFLVDWGGVKDKPKAALGVGPGSVTVRGTF